MDLQGQHTLKAKKQLKTGLIEAGHAEMKDSINFFPFLQQNQIQNESSSFRLVTARVGFPSFSMH